VQIQTNDHDHINSVDFKQTAWISIDGNTIHLSDQEKYNLHRKMPPSLQDQERMNRL